jgi:hypothetical protein
MASNSTTPRSDLLDLLRSDRLRSDRLRSDLLRSDRLRSDRLRSDRLRSDRLRSAVNPVLPGHVRRVLGTSNPPARAAPVTEVAPSTHIVSDEGREARGGNWGSASRWRL